MKRTMKRIVLMLLWTGGLLGCARDGVAPAAAPAGDPGWLGPPPSVQVYPESAERIHLQDTAAMLSSRWEGAAKTDRQRVELVTPQGRIYEVVETLLGPAGDAEIRMALGGTMVEEYHLHGTWKARYFINAGTAPVREVAFEVEP